MVEFGNGRELKVMGRKIMESDRRKMALERSEQGVRTGHRNAVDATGGK